MVHAQHRTVGRANQRSLACVLALTALVFSSLADSAQAQPAGKTRTPSWMKHVPSNCNNLIATSDLKPHLERAIRSDRLARLLSQGDLADALKELNSPLYKADPKRLLDVLDQVDRYLPDEWALAGNGDTFRDMVPVLRTLLLMTLCHGAIDAGPDSIKTDLPTLQTALVESLIATRIPRSTVYLKLRDPRDVGMLFNLSKISVVPFLRLRGFKIDVYEDAIEFKADVADLLSDDQVRGWLTEGKIILDGKSRNADDIVDGIRSIKIHAWIVDVDDALVITFGPKPKKRGISARELGPLWTPEQPPIVFARWEIANFQREILAVYNEWNKWSKTKTGQQAQESDILGYIENLKWLVYDMGRTASKGTIRITADNKKLEAILQEDGLKEVVSLTDSDLSKFVPKDASFVTATTSRSMSDSLIMWGRWFQERFNEARRQNAFAERWEERQKARAKAAGDKPKAEDAAPEAEQPRRRRRRPRRPPRWMRNALNHYDTKLGTMRSKIFVESGDLFENSQAFIVAHQGKVKDFKFSFKERTGATLKIRNRDLPAPEFAWIGKVKDPDKALAYVGDLYHLVVDSLEPTKKIDLYKPVDLGLGVPTRAFAAPWTKELLEELEFDVEGDLKLHCFVVDQFVVVSSSPRLSKAVLEAKKGQNARFKWPSVKEGQLISYTSIPPKEIDAFLDDVSKWFAPKPWTTRGFTPPEDAQQGMHRMSKLLEGIGDLRRLTEKVEITAKQRPDKMRETVLRITWAQ